MPTNNTMQNIRFLVQALSETINTRATKGVLFLVLDDTNVQGLYTYTKLKKVTEEYEGANKSIIATAFSDYGVKKVVVAAKHDESGITVSLDGALALLNKVSLNGWLAVPQITGEAEKKKVADFIKSQRNDEDYPLKGVLANYKADHEAIVNFTGDNLGDDITSEQYAAEVAMLLCTLGANESITNHIAKNVTSCDIKDDNDTCVANGELFLFNNGNNIVFSRGVNSLQTIAPSQSETLTKIRIVETIDMVKADMREIFEESYFGKIGNSYINRKTLINSLNSYLKNISNEGYLSNDVLSTAELDAEATRTYLEGRGVDTDDMTDDDVLKQNLETHVFAKATLRIMDTIEDIDLVLQYTS
ncbi:phage tail sheath C-terminal domain-containing protein [Clostridium neonatale]|uniref:phage tail sheath C-terminal domain-containing protein n=1 Tax=Clostridium neonatale TaxID=137838 RepID=UPI001DB456DD|nr:phage tail sheath C-terminal domain-containing protein [Clostridium neonatale]CAG9714701.1 Phage tail sheath protein [Clostridium neonatale]